LLFERPTTYITPQKATACTNAVLAVGRKLCWMTRSATSASGNQAQLVKAKSALLKSHMVAQTYPGSNIAVLSDGVSGAQVTSSPCNFLQHVFLVAVSVACMQGNYANF